MDTIPACPRLPPAPCSPAPPPGVPPVRGWQQLLPQAVALAWRQDPEVMAGLLGRLLAVHVDPQGQRLQATLDELHLMVAMELQALAGYPD